MATNASSQGQAQGAAEAQGSAEGIEFLNQYAGVGTKDIGQEAKSTNYLSITNALSTDAKANGAVDGDFYNSGTMHVLGKEVRVVLVAFKTVWDEKDASGKTLARYEKKSIPVQLVPPPPGKTGYPTMINPDTGNKIVETFAYALVLPDDSSAGFVMMTAGVGSMKAFRRWNTTLGQIRLPNGDQAPIFAKIWKLVSGKRISRTTGKEFYGLESVVDSGNINSEMFNTLILPARQQSTQFLLAAPDSEPVDATGDAE